MILLQELNTQNADTAFQLFEKYRSIRKLYDRLPGIKDTQVQPPNKNSQNKQQIKRFSSCLSEII